MNQQHNEINFIDLARILWKKKLVVSLFTLLFMVVSGIYAFATKEKWTSSSEVIPPRITDVSEYISLRREYASITGEEFDAVKIINDLHSLFSLYALSFDKRETILSGTDYYHNLIKGLPEEKKSIVLTNLARDDFSITKPDTKKNPNILGVVYGFTAETAYLAQDVLKIFLNKASQNAFIQHKSEFRYWVKERIDVLNYEKLIIERDLPIQRSLRIQNLSNALEMAKEAGIKDYNSLSSDGTLNNLVLSDTKIPLSNSKLADDTYLFMLGEKYLQAQLDIAKSTPVVYPQRYYQIQDELDKLNVILSKLEDVKGQAFSYVSSPDEPVQRDWPKRFLLLIIGAVLGGVLGSAFVLVKSLFSKNYE